MSHSQRVAEKVGGALRAAEAEAERYKLQRQRALVTIQALNRQNRALGKACGELHRTLQTVVSAYRGGSDEDLVAAIAVAGTILDQLEQARVAVEKRRQGGGGGEQRSSEVPADMRSSTARLRQDGGER